VKRIARFLARRHDDATINRDEREYVWAFKIIIALFTG